MFYFGRIISAFFNQLFRFLLWNKFGQKLLIILIISLIAFWCVGMTKVHAVEEVNDVNYEVKSYYNGVVNDVINRLGSMYSDGYITIEQIQGICRNSTYFYYGSIYGSSYNGAKPLNGTKLYIYQWPTSSNLLYYADISTNDYMGVTGYTMYLTKSTTPNGFAITSLNGKASYNEESKVQVFIPYFITTYVDSDWADFCWKMLNSSEQEIVQLLEDIKAEQQATNDFLNEETDTSNMVIETPSVTDEASDNMSNNLHNQINTLTTDLQNTVNNYYEGWNAYTWSIPLPNYIGGNITFDSGVTRRIIGTSGVVYNIIQAIWVVLFGGYIVGFIKRMLDWVQTGKIFDEGGIADFIWWIDTNNEIIKASMM